MFDIFQFAFMQRAFVAGIVIAVIAPLIGMFLVVRRYSLMADTLAHVSLAGIALAFLFNVHPLAGALIASLLAALGIEMARRSKTGFEESALALFLSGGLAFATVLLSATDRLNVNLLSFLFGSISTVTPSDLYVIIPFGILVAITIALLYKELFAVSFDEELASAQGMRAKAFILIIMALSAVTVSLAIRIVGVLLTGALMVIPVISALRFGYGFRSTLFFSILFSLVTVICGLLVAFAFNLASGGVIVLLALFIFILSSLLNR